MQARQRQAELMSVLVEEAAVRFNNNCTKITDCERSYSIEGRHLSVALLSHNGIINFFIQQSLWLIGKIGGRRQKVVKPAWGSFHQQAVLIFPKSVGKM